MGRDILIKGGRVIDPARGIDRIEDIFISNGKIAALPESGEFAAGNIIDASSKLVMPGLIDYHAHVFTTGSDFSVFPSLMASSGVTTVVDGGSSGSTNYAAFKVFAQSQAVRLTGFLNVSPCGLTTLKYHENIDPRYWDRERITQIFEDPSGKPAGLKIRISHDIVKELGLKPLNEAIKLAGEIDSRLVVHVTDPPEKMDKIVDILRPGDVFCHLYQGFGPTIIENGKVIPSIIEGRRRGVIFDASNGRSHFCFRVAEPALHDGFPPDVISTDITKDTYLTSYSIGLPHLIAKYLYLGMDMGNIIRTMTYTPAKLLGLEGTIGTLAPGAHADIAIFSMENGRVTFKDSHGETRHGNIMLIPQLTMKDGNILFRQYNFF